MHEREDSVDFRPVSRNREALSCVGVDDVG